MCDGATIEILSLDMLAICDNRVTRHPLPYDQKVANLPKWPAVPGRCERMARYLVVPQDGKFPWGEEMTNSVGGEPSCARARIIGISRLDEGSCKHQDPFQKSCPNWLLHHCDGMVRRHAAGMGKTQRLEMHLLVNKLPPGRFWGGRILRRQRCPVAPVPSFRTSRQPRLPVGELRFRPENLKWPTGES